MSDDAFYGSYKGTNIKINEIGINKKGRFLFQGLVITCDMNKKITGHTIIVGNTTYRTDLKRIHMESADFEKSFNVFSTDHIEARYLITPSFMERFQELSKVFKTKRISAAFYNNKLIITIDVQKNLFILGSLFTPVNNTKQYETLFKQITSLFSVIDVLKLDINTGL